MLRHRLRVALLAAIAGITFATDASAGEVPIKIVLDGLSLSYQSDLISIFDSSSITGGQGDPLTATKLTGASFYKDGVLQGQLSSASADVRLNSPLIPLDGTSVSLTSGGQQYFDLLTAANSSGNFWGLALNQSEWTVRYDLEGSSEWILGSATATLCATCVPNQAGLFGLEFDPSQAISVSFRVQISDKTVSDNKITSFRATGSATITGMMSGATVVAEPTSAVLAMLGAVALIAGRTVSGHRRRFAG